VRRAPAWLAALALASGCATQGSDLPTLPGAAKGRLLALGLPERFETSGAVWHAGSGRLLVVSDEGVLALVSLDGKERTFVDVGGDLEAVTLTDPKSSFAYVGVERPAAIVEVDLRTLQVTRRFDLEGILSGLEGLAFVPDGAGGGTFWVGVQEDARVVEVMLPLPEGGPARKVREFVPVAGMRDLADLGYDAVQGVVLALYDKGNRLVMLSRDGEVRGSWSLPGREQEAVATLPGGLAIGDDASGEVILYPSLPSPRPR